MPLLLNSFPVEISPLQILLPYLDYPSWQNSTTTRDTHFANFLTWRYELDEKEVASSPNRFRMVFLQGRSVPPAAQTASFDLGRFWRIGCLLAEDSLSAHFSKLGYTVERSQFERVALSKQHGSPDGEVELATGVSFSARRPFREEPYSFSVTFQWVVRAFFRHSLESDALARIAIGMPVLYKPISGRRESSNPQVSSVLRSLVYERIQSVQFVQSFVEKVQANELGLGTYGAARVDKLRNTGATFDRPASVQLEVEPPTINSRDS